MERAGWWLFPQQAEHVSPRSCASSATKHDSRLLHAHAVRVRMYGDGKALKRCEGSIRRVCQKGPFLDGCGQVHYCASFVAGCIFVSDRSSSKKWKRRG